jgi:hypothetical protein
MQKALRRLFYERLATGEKTWQISFFLPQVIERM